jgi:hypothetical protein
MFCYIRRETHTGPNPPNPVQSTVDLNILPQLMDGILSQSEASRVKAMKNREDQL